MKERNVTNIAAILLRTSRGRARGEVFSRSRDSPRGAGKDADSVRQQKKQLKIWSKKELKTETDKEDIKKLEI